MNNNFFTIARFLRDRGFDAEVLLLDGESEHFHPSADTFYDDYKNFIKTVQWRINKRNMFKKRAEIISDLKPYHFLITCGGAPASVELAGRTADLMIPYGSDIFDVPFIRFSKNPLQQIRFIACAWLQRRAIQKTRFIQMESDYFLFKKAMNKLTITGKLLQYPLPVVYTKDFGPDTIQQFYNKSKYYPQFQELRNNHDLVVFYHARHSWKKPKDNLTFKGTDNLFKGFAKLVKNKPDVKACIVTMEYGEEVEETKKLIGELGLQEKVFWFPLMQRKEIMVGLSLADVACGEFYWSCFGCGVIFETLAMGKPLFHYRDDQQYRNAYSTMYPLVKVKTDEEIRQALHDYVDHPTYFKEMGLLGRKWYVEQVIHRAIDAYCDILYDHEKQFHLL